MPSRMERYYENDELSTGRSNKNRSLYDQIQSLDNYTNIEGVETIENNNEIDISRVKKMINNRENYRKERELKSILNEKTEQVEEKEATFEEEKNYDINDILSKVKRENTEDENYRKLDEKSYKELKNISRKAPRVSKEDNEELNELLKTIRVSKEEQAEILDDDAGLLDDLKSDTVVGDAASIKKIIEEEKGKEYEKTEEIDRSFYTTNFGLTKKDFEDLKDLNVQVSKTNNKIMIMLMIIIIIIIIAFTVIIFT